MPQSQNLEDEVALLQAMADELEAYLLSDELYRQLVVHTPHGDQVPRMSLGTFLETLATLEQAADAGRLTPAQWEAVNEARHRLEEMRRRFPTAFRDKLVRELKSNLDSWNWFLQECREDPRRCRDEYRFEVRIRNRIATLVDALGEETPPEYAARLERLDAQLRHLLVPGSFLWAKALEARYPRERYWWLYGQIGA